MIAHCAVPDNRLALYVEFHKSFYHGCFRALPRMREFPFSHSTVATGTPDSLEAPALMVNLCRRHEPPQSWALYQIYLT